jgi:hypothetical protein
MIIWGMGGEICSLMRIFGRDGRRIGWVLGLGRLGMGFGRGMGRGMGEKRKRGGIRRVLGLVMVKFSLNAYFSLSSYVGVLYLCILSNVLILRLLVE